MSTARADIFFAAKNSQKYPLVHSKRGFRTELPAAEATDAVMVIEFKPSPLYGYDPGRTCLRADSAQDALLLYLHRPGRQVVSEPVLDKTGKTEFDIRERWQSERGDMNVLQSCADSLYLAPDRAGESQFLCLSFHKKELFRNAGNLASNHINCNRIYPCHEQADMTGIAVSRSVPFHCRDRIDNRQIRGTKQINFQQNPGKEFAVCAGLSSVLVALFKK